MKLAILDRDGTINADSAAYIRSAEDFKPLPGAIEAIARLCHAGWRIVIASNQSGLARGYFGLSDLIAMQAKLSALLLQAGARLDAFFFCPHGPDEGCDCRKPKAGLLHSIARRYGVELQGVPLVGDSLRDMQAAAEMGCEPHFLGGSEDRNLIASLPRGSFLHRDLAAFASFLLARNV